MHVQGWQQQVDRMLEAHAAIIAVAGQIDAVLEAVVNSALIAMPRATGAVIEIRDGEDMVYRAATDHALARRIGFRLAVAGSLSGVCMDSGEPLLCHDTEQDSRVNREACRATQVRSMVVLPIPLQGVNIGVLKVFSSQECAFDEQDLMFARLLVAPVACGFANVAQMELARTHNRLARRFEATFDQAAVGIVHVAPSGQLLHMNQRFCEVTGRSAQELAQCTFQDITHPDDLAIDLEHFAALTAGQVDRYQMEKRYIRPDGSVIWINLTVSMVPDDHGAPDFFVAVVEDISRRKDAETLALRDTLTGLPNRRAMLERLGSAVAALPDAGSSMAVAYLDLDHFKQVNDRLGHGVGDACLVEVASAITGAIRQRDTLYRIAGDEFVLLLPGCSAADVDRVLDRLSRAIAERVAGKDWKIGVSAGAVVLAPGTRTSVEAIIQAADAMMYNVKVGRKDGEHLALAAHRVVAFAEFAQFH
jgi:diguanylate cyclase (GGDEF)-like protein/PAS domain S-box-containing protein